MKKWRPRPSPPKHACVITRMREGDNLYHMLNTVNTLKCPIVGLIYDIEKTPY